jgi:NitT/TauT family transport system ATP-binding protein
MKNNITLEIKNLTKIFRDYKHNRDILALNNINFNVRKNEFLCIVGPSGCGKTTLLHLIAGLERPTSGEICLNQKNIPGPCSCRALVFQETAIYPWKSALENVEFGLEIQGIPKKQRRTIALKYLETVGLKGFENCRPHQLSGGMKQKVQIARVLALNPKLLLLDEPFAAMDEISRTRLDIELLNIWGKNKKTVIFVTHSLEEAIILADRIMIFSAHPGKIKYEYKLNIPRPREMFSPGMIAIRKDLREKLFYCYPPAEDRLN